MDFCQVTPLLGMNNVNNAVKPLLVKEIFVQRLVNNGEQGEQSSRGAPGLFTSFMLIHEAVNK
jgi:hypothetical protein